jgi:alpha-L-fucosidase
MGLFSEQTTRRGFVTRLSATLGAAGLFPEAFGAAQTRRPTPSRAQLEWQRDELAMFLHFGVNTFTDREWGDGREDPAIFAPAPRRPRLAARRAAGFRAMILTAKHHDGFCLWPTKTRRTRSRRVHGAAAGAISCASSSTHAASRA